MELLLTFVAAAIAVGVVKYVQHRRRLTARRYDAMFEDIIARNHLRKSR